MIVNIGLNFIFMNFEFTLHTLIIIGLVNMVIELINKNQETIWENHKIRLMVNVLFIFLLAIFMLPSEYDEYLVLLSIVMVLDIIRVIWEIKRLKVNTSK